MKSNFAIAYSDKSGKDLNGIPWLFDDVNDKEGCVVKALEMISDGFKNVIPFCFDDNRKQNVEEIIEWQYVKEHRIDNTEARERIFMKTYKENRTFDLICHDMERKGMRVDTSDFDKGGDFVYFKGAWHGYPWTIKYNIVNGGFFVYNGFTGELVATHMNTELDNELWYIDLMNTFYKKDNKN